jgi:hypothetical protein
MLQSADYIEDRLTWNCFITRPRCLSEHVDAESGVRGSNVSERLLARMGPASVSPERSLAMMRSRQTSPSLNWIDMFDTC